MTTPYDISTEINGSKFFSILDMNQAFHQLELDDVSKEVTTFSTHMGISSATEVFQ